MKLNTRQSHILYQAICHPGTSGEDIAQQEGISTRTLSADIDLINAELLEYRLEVENRRGAGYFCRWEDRRDYDFMKAQLICREYYGLPNQSDFAERVGDILRLLLLADRYLRTEVIAERLWLTRSSIRQELRETRGILSRYGLELDAKPHHGVAIAGKESAIRQCMVDFCKPYHHTLEPISFLDDGYSRYGFDHKQVKMIYQTLADLLMETNLKICEQSLQRLVVWVLVSQHRQGLGHTVALPNALEQCVSGHQGYILTTQLLENCSISLPETERAFLTLILLSYADHDAHPLLESRTLELYNQLQSYYHNQLHISFTADPLFAMELKSLLTRYVIRSVMGLREFEYGGPAHRLASMLPVSRQLAVDSLYILEEFSGHRADQSLLTAFTMLFYNTVMAIPSNQKRLKMLCVGPHNQFASRSIAYKIQAQHQNYVDRIDFCEVHELNFLSLRQYDYIITSEPIEVLPNQNLVPVMALNYFMNWKDLYGFRNRVILPKVSLQSLFSRAVGSAPKVIASYPTPQEFIQWASEEIGLPTQERIDYLLDAHCWLPILPQNGKAALFCCFGEPAYAMLFQFESTVCWERSDIQYAFLCRIPLDFDTQVLKSADSLLRRMLMHSDPMSLFATQEEVSD